MKIMLNYLEIETCSLCNQTCPWCLFGQIPDFREKTLQLLDIAYIKKILLELRQNDFKGTISFYSMNEPLLDKRITDGSIFQLCREIIGEEVAIKIHTNGVLLTAENVSKMLHAGLDKIFISCYEEDIIRKAKKLKNVYKKIEILNYTKENAKQLKCNRAGSILPYETAPNESKKKCTLPIFSSVIGFDGEIRICCNDPLGQIKLGNIKNEDLFAVLNGKKASMLRNKILTNREDVFPCNICNFEETPNYRFDFDRS